MFVTCPQEEKAHACLASMEGPKLENLNGKVHPDENRELETENLGNTKKESAVFG